jgi:hypothetical protein
MQNGIAQVSHSSPPRDPGCIFGTQRNLPFARQPQDGYAASVYAPLLLRTTPSFPSSESLSGQPLAAPCRLGTPSFRPWSRWPLLVVSRAMFLVPLAARHSPEPSTRVSQLALEARLDMIHPRSLSAAARLLHRNRTLTPRARFLVLSRNHVEGLAGCLPGCFIRATGKDVRY